MFTAAVPVYKQTETACFCPHQRKRVGKMKDISCAVTAQKMEPNKSKLIKATDTEDLPVPGVKIRYLTLVPVSPSPLTVPFPKGIQTRGGMRGRSNTASLGKHHFKRLFFKILQTLSLDTGRLVAFLYCWTLSNLCYSN